MPKNMKAFNAMKKTYGAKKAKQVYYATLNKGKIKEPAAKPKKKGKK